MSKYRTDEYRNRKNMRERALRRAARREAEREAEVTALVRNWPVPRVRVLLGRVVGPICNLRWRL